jgi:hypothetical protein
MVVRMAWTEVMQSLLKVYECLAHVIAHQWFT